MASLVPIWILDFAGNAAILGLSAYLVFSVTSITKMRPHRPLWMYLEWQVMALAVFALSHSVGHIVRRLLIMAGYGHIWEGISPYTGSINSVSFVVVAILTFLYKDVEFASERLDDLEQAKKDLEVYAGKLQASYKRMEADAEEILLKNKDLAALNRVAVAVSKSLEMDKVLSAVVGEVKEFIGADFLGIYLVESGSIALKLCEGMSPEFVMKASRRSLDEPWLKREVMAGNPFFTQERPGEKAGRIDPAIKAGGVQAWAAAPLMAKGKVVGVLTAGSGRYDGIDQRRLNTLVTIGGYIGVVIENSLLYEELKLKVEDLERFRKFSVGREMRIIELKERLKAAQPEKT